MNANINKGRTLSARVKGNEDGVWTFLNLAVDFPDGVSPFSDPGSRVCENCLPLPGRGLDFFDSGSDRMWTYFDPDRDGISRSGSPKTPEIPTFRYPGGQILAGS